MPYRRLIMDAKEKLARARGKVTAAPDSAERREGLLCLCDALQALTSAVEALSRQEAPSASGRVLEPPPREAR